MRFVSILSLTVILVSVNGISIDKLTKDADESNVKRRFDIAIREGKGYEFIEAIVKDSEKHGLLQKIGDDAYEYIPADGSLMKTLSTANGSKWSVGFFASAKLSDREKIVEYLITAGDCDTLKAIGDDGYRLVLINREPVRTLVKAKDPKMFKEFFASRTEPSDHKKIVKYLISLKAYPTLKAIGDDGYKLVSINKGVVSTLVGAKDSEMFKDFFESRDRSSDRKKIVKYLVSSEDYPVLKDLGREVSKYLPLTKDSVKVLVEIDDFDLVENFYERLPRKGINKFTKKQFIKELKKLDAYDKFKGVDSKSK